MEDILAREVHAKFQRLWTSEQLSAKTTKSVPNSAWIVNFFTDPIFSQRASQMSKWAEIWHEHHALKRLSP